MGQGEGSRTPDTGIFSPLLYQLSYPAIWCGNYYTKLPHRVKDFFLDWRICGPGHLRIRPYDAPTLGPVIVRRLPHTSRVSS